MLRRIRHLFVAIFGAPPLLSKSKRRTNTNIPSVISASRIILVMFIVHGAFADDSALNEVHKTVNESVLLNAELRPAPPLYSLHYHYPPSTYPPMHPHIYTSTSWFEFVYVTTGMKTLVEAVYSGDPGAVGAVVGIIGHDQAVKQLSALRINDSYQLETVVMSAARGGDTQMFYAVLRSLRQTLAESQVIRYGKFRHICRCHGEGEAEGTGAVGCERRSTAIIRRVDLVALGGVSEERYTIRYFVTSCVVFRFPTLRTCGFHSAQEQMYWTMERPA